MSISFKKYCSTKYYIQTHPHNERTFKPRAKFLGEVQTAFSPHKKPRLSLHLKNLLPWSN